MLGVTNLNIRIGRDLKIKAVKLFNEMGMDLTTAVNMFVRQAVLERAIPFKVHRGYAVAEAKPGIEERRAAMREIRGLLAGIDGNSIDLNQIKAERRAIKYERVAFNFRS